MRDPQTERVILQGDESPRSIPALERIGLISYHSIPPTFHGGVNRQEYTSTKGLNNEKGHKQLSLCVSEIYLFVICYFTSVAFITQ